MTRWTRGFLLKEKNEDAEFRELLALEPVSLVMID